MNVYELIAKEKKERTGKLDIGRCGLTELPDELFELEWLEELFISNRYWDIAQKSWIESENKGANNILSYIPPGFLKLTNLERLFISGEDHIRWKIKKIENLPLKLTKLVLCGNQINKLENLPQGLLQLEIGSNLIEKLENLPQGMISLYIQFNQISTIENLPRGLQQLDLRSNQIIKLENLSLSINYLDVRANKIDDISQLNNLLIFKDLDLGSPTIFNNFNFDGSRLRIPPPEIVQYGKAAILKYFEELKRGKDYVYEAKLLIVGEPGAGKTTLFRKLNDFAAEMPREDESTQGIDIHTISFPNKVDPKKDFRVNLWDFGGQEIYHSTHQFFLTKRSLYILVTDSRKEDTDFNYWLQVIELLSIASPIIILQNEKGERKTGVDLRGLQGRFKNIIGLHSFDLSRDEEKLKKLKDAISYNIQALEHVGSELPIRWIEVREELKQKAFETPFINEDTYYKICEEKGIKEKETALFLSGYFHDLGTFLHFKDDPVLRHYIFLRNEWATDAVYALLDDAIVQFEKKGHFDRTDVDRILNKEEYWEMHNEVLQLMLKFELSYRIPDQKAEQYVAPQLLTREKPEYKWQLENSLQITYQYDFMPKGLMSRLIVKLHRYATNFNHLWRTGAIFYRSGAKAEVVETYGTRNINIRVEGINKKELLTIILEELDFLSSGYEGLRYEKMVPCNCKECRISRTPYFFKYSDLYNRLGKKKMTIECNYSIEEVDIPNLLGEFFADKTSIRMTEPIHALKVFISYSKHDQEDLEMFKKVITPLQRKELLITWDDTDLIPAEEWDERIKGKIKEADVIVFLTSIHSLATDYIDSVEMKIALDRHMKHEALILPIILYECLWEETDLSKYHALPSKGRPIHSKEWDNVSKAWVNVAKGIKRMISDFVMGKDEI
jgi:internalin A